MRYIVALALFLAVMPLCLASDYGAGQIPIPSGAEAVLEEQTPLDTDLNGGLSKLLDTAMDLIKAQSGGALRTLFLLVAVAVLMGIASGMWNATGGTADTAIRVAGILAAAAVSFGGTRALIDLTRDTVTQIGTFSKALLPVMATATVATGAPAGAVARHAATLLFSDVLITVIDRFLLPAAYLYAAALTADAALGGAALSGVVRFIKWGTGTLLKVLMTVYVGYLTVSGAVAGAADAMLQKSAKLAISGMVPVVGGILSDASETVIAGAGIVKSSVGVFGLLAVLGVVLTPIITLGINYLLYKLAAAVAAPAAPPAITEFLEKLSDVFALMLGMTASAALLLLIGIVSCMMVG
ncbi:hypothetical protein FACS1894217_06010 [Clostridia bacterium]|nr:hypothetical protein FACS1894217_06010 [Clostridia bacterium]